MWVDADVWDDPEPWEDGTVGSTAIEHRLSIITGAAGNVSAQPTPAVSLGKYLSISRITPGQVGNLFPKITTAQAAGELIHYLCVFIVNTSMETFSDVKVWIVSQEPRGADIAIGVDPTAASAIGSASAQAVQATSITTAPAGVTFLIPGSEDTGLDMGTIGPTQCKAIWFKRSSEAHPRALLRDEVNYRISGLLTAAPVESDGSIVWAIDPSNLRIEQALTGVERGAVTYDFSLEKRTIDNQFVEDVTHLLKGGWVDLNNDRDISRSAQFELEEGALDVINYFADYLAPYMELLVDEVTVRLQMGLYTLVEPSSSLSRGASSVRIEGRDLAYLLANAATPTTYRVASGTNIITAVRNVINAVNTSLRKSLPASSDTAPTDLSWPPGTYYMKILTDNGNGLLDGIGYYQLYATRTGVLSTREREDLADRSPDVVYTDDDFVLDDVITTGGPNIHYNQIIAVVNDPERAPLYSVKTNSDPASVISTVSTGKTFTRQVNVEKAANQAALDKIARQYLREEANDLRHAKITTSLDPRRENHEVYEIHIEDLEETSEVWRAQSWRLPLQVGGKMTHEIRKVESLKLT